MRGGIGWKKKQKKKQEKEWEEFDSNGAP